MPFPPRRVCAVYDRRAAGFDRFVDVTSLGHDRTLREFYVKRLRPRGIVLDVGCGTGRDMALLGRTATVVGIDLSRGMLSRAPRDPGFHYIRADAARLPVRAEAAGAVLCTYTVSTVGDWRAALGEMVRALEPGGRLLISEDRLPPGWYMGPGPMLRHFTRFGWACVEGPLWRMMNRCLRRCRRGSALFGLLFWIEGRKPGDSRLER